MKHVKNHNSSYSHQKSSNVFGFKLNHSFSKSFSALIAKYNVTITPTISNVNVIRSLVINRIASHPAQRLEQIADATFNCARVGSKESLTRIIIP